ncbi:MAG: hypothetical protein RLZZ245_2198 [Verrucomicrobiota bacterium]
MRNLSKSKIIAFRQCPKRLWLEVHKNHLRDDSASEAVFQIGYQVGNIAQTLYDPEGMGETIDIVALGHGEALARSAKLLLQGLSPVFEAGLSMDGALAYADVMLPERSSGGLQWKMIEVKSSTSVKPYHLDDIAVQTHIAINSGVSLASVSLAHIDSSFVYPGGGDYQGLLKEVDLTEPSFSRDDEVREWIAAAHAVAELAEEPVVPTGIQCSTPFTCGFCGYCNRDRPPVPYPLSSLPYLSKTKRTSLEEDGYDDLRDVPDDQLNATQMRVKKCSTTGVPYFDAKGAAADLSSFKFPATFLDFETVNFVIPIWKGTRPYQQVPFQFSLHRVGRNGRIEHAEFLDLSGDDPSLLFARSLVEQCGTKGPVFVYSAAFECSRIRELAQRFPDLEPALLAINDRVVDLLPIARDRYYHPSQQGSWSIKAVLPALCPELSYSQLDGVQDGTAAVEAFKKAIAVETTPAERETIRLQLLEYCKLDTYALVRMWQIFRGC